MKLFRRILILFLTLVLALSVFVGCNDDVIGDDPDEDTDADEIDDYFPDIEKADYGEDFMMFVMKDSNPIEFYVLDESNGSPMDEAVYARQQKVNKYLGVEILATNSPTGTSFSNYHEIVQNAVNNRDGTVDSCITHVQFGVNSLISEGYIRDLSEMDGLDLDAEYWNKDFMETLELNGRIYLGYSDYNIMYTNVIAFNKDMMAQYEASIPKSVYDLVTDYEWTLDELISLSNLVYTDTTGNGKTLDDTYGFSGYVWVSFCGMLQACDVNMMEQDESGMYKMSINSSKNYAKTEIIISKIRDWAQSNCAYIAFQANTSGVAFTTGRVLFGSASTNNLSSMLDYDLEFGVLPFPMYDTNQKNVGYRSLQWGGYITVPVYVKNEQKVADTLELLAFYSENVKITYYEKLLGKQVADMPEDAAMLDIIWDSVCTDVGQTFYNTAGNNGICYTVPIVADPDYSGGLSSFIKQRENAVNTGFQKFLNGIK